jgi:hypothetical protein
MSQSEHEKSLLDMDDSELPRGDVRDLEDAAREASEASRRMQMRWKVALVVFVVWFSATVIYGVARRMCVKKS